MPEAGRYPTPPIVTSHFFIWSFGTIFIAQPALLKVSEPVPLSVGSWIPEPRGCRGALRPFAFEFQPPTSPEYPVPPGECPIVFSIPAAKSPSSPGIFSQPRIQRVHRLVHLPLIQILPHRILVILKLGVLWGNQFHEFHDEH